MGFPKNTAKLFEAILMKDQGSAGSRWTEGRKREVTQPE